MKIKKAKLHIDGRLARLSGDFVEKISEWDQLYSIETKRLKNYNFKWFEGQIPEILERIFRKLWKIFWKIHFLWNSPSYRYVIASNVSGYDFEYT